MNPLAVSHFESKCFCVTSLLNSILVCLTVLGPSTLQSRLHGQQRSRRLLAHADRTWNTLLGAKCRLRMAVNSASVLALGFSGDKTSCGANVYRMNIINQHGNRCYPPFWWSKLPVVIVRTCLIMKLSISKRFESHACTNLCSGELQKQI